MRGLEYGGMVVTFMQSENEIIVTFIRDNKATITEALGQEAREARECLSHAPRVQKMVRDSLVRLLLPPAPWACFRSFLCRLVQSGCHRPLGGEIGLDVLH